MNMRFDIMIVEDDRDGREYVEELVRSLGHLPLGFEDGPSALAALSRGFTPAIALLDVMLPGMDGVELTSRLKAMSPATVCLMLSALEEADTIVHAVQAGASGYLVKPVSAPALKDAIVKAISDHDIEKKFEAMESAARALGASGEILSGDREMLRLQEIARRVADTDVPVLLTGESGVGKEVLARFIHMHSSRRSRAFVKVNCAALPHELLESELFGHEKGSFTGAHADRAGRFEMADKGTIFLDEIGEMSAVLQAKLLHVLQDGEFSRVGGRTMRVDARVVAATNKRLEDAVRHKEFREDLYYRLNVVRMSIPPLRERAGDIPLLAEHFFAKFASKYNTRLRELPDEVMEQFKRHSWPGNVRELENAVKRYVVIPDAALAIQGMDAGTATIAPPSVMSAPPVELGVASGTVLKDAASAAAERVERELVLKTLNETAWNRKEAARRLGICYKALLNKLKKWDMGTIRSSEPELVTAPGQTAAVASRTFS
jgi:DNA-binding NtrC family response regulator